MSLTSVLDDSASPERAFFNDLLPRTRAVAAAARQAVDLGQVLVPVPAGVDGTYPYGAVGAGFDYLLRVRLSAAIATDTGQDPGTAVRSLVEASVAASGARILARRAARVGRGGDRPNSQGRPARPPAPPGRPDPDEFATMREFFAAYRQWSAQHSPERPPRPVARLRGWDELVAVIGDLASAAEAVLPDRTGADATLARGCIALGLYEAVFRRGPDPGWPVVALAPDAALPQVLALVPEAAVEDVLALERLARQRAPRLFAAPAGPVALGPTFAGSGHVGGADADLIVDGTLVELKVTVDARRKGLAPAVRQLLGYALLDWDDEHHITTGALYFARQGAWLEWPLKDLAALLAGAPIDLPDLRARFRGVCEAGAALRT